MELIRGASIVSGQRRRCAEEAPGDLAESGGTRRHSSRKVNASSLRQTKGGHEEYVLLHRWKRAEHRETESSGVRAKSKANEMSSGSGMMEDFLECIFTRR